MNDTQEERRDYKAYVKSTAAGVVEARKRKNIAKEMLEHELEKDKKYTEAQDKAFEAGKEKKIAKSNAILASKPLQELQEKFKDANDELKDAQDSLSGALEAQFIATGKFDLDVEGMKVVMGRKFSLSSQQLSLFE